MATGTWDILFTAKFKADIDRLNQSGISPFLDSLNFLKSGPHLSKNKLKPMKAASKSFRWRKGDLRVIFRLISDSKEILLLRAGRRQSIYKKTISKTQKAIGKLDDLIYDISNFEESIEIAKSSETLELFPDLIEDSIVEEIFIDQSDLYLLDIPVEFHDELMICETLDEASKINLPQNIYTKIEDYITSPHHDHVGKIYGLDKIDGVDHIASQPLSSFLIKLDPQQEKIVNRSFAKGPVLIKGGPGTGKTLINLARIRKIFDKNIGHNLFSTQPKKVAFITFNKPLSLAAEEMFNEISRDKNTDSVDFFTLDSFVYQNTNDTLEIANENIQLNYIRHSLRLAESTEFSKSYISEFVSNNNLSYVLEEFEDVIQAKDLDQAAYLTPEGHRKGRKKALGGKQRKLIWSLYENWLQTLNKMKLTTFSGRRLSTLKLLNSGELSPLKYDYVFVDELQDLSVVSLKIVTHLIKNIKNLTFSADTAQSIYLQAPSWNNIHADLKFNRSNSHILKQSYRMTKEITNAISPLRLNSGDAESENDGISNALYNGPLPLWLKIPEEKHFAHTINIINDICLSGRVNINQIAIIVTMNRDALELHDILAKNQIRSEVVSSKKKINIKGAHLHIMTVHVAKGLEFPFVIVPKVIDGRYPNQKAISNCSSEEEVMEQKEKAKRLLYVALSRAAKKLWMLSDDAKPCALLKDLQGEYWDVKRITESEKNYN